MAGILEEGEASNHIFVVRRGMCVGTRVALLPAGGGALGTTMQSRAASASSAAHRNAAHVTAGVAATMKAAQAAGGMGVQASEPRGSVTEATNVRIAPAAASSTDGASEAAESVASGDSDDTAAMMRKILQPTTGVGGPFGLTVDVEFDAGAETAAPAPPPPPDEAAPKISLRPPRRPSSTSQQRFERDHTARVANTSKAALRRARARPISSLPDFPAGIGRAPEPPRAAPVWVRVPAARLQPGAVAGWEPKASLTLEAAGPSVVLWALPKAGLRLALSTAAVESMVGAIVDTVQQRHNALADSVRRLRAVALTQEDDVTKRRLDEGVASRMVATGAARAEVANKVELFRNNNNKDTNNVAAAGSNNLVTAGEPQFPRPPTATTLDTRPVRMWSRTATDPRYMVTYTVGGKHKRKVAADVERSARRDHRRAAQAGREALDKAKAEAAMEKRLARMAHDAVVSLFAASASSSMVQGGGGGEGSGAWNSPSNVARAAARRALGWAPAVSVQDDDEEDDGASVDGGHGSGIPGAQGLQVRFKAEAGSAGRVRTRSGDSPPPERKQRRLRQNWRPLRGEARRRGHIRKPRVGVATNTNTSVGVEDSAGGSVLWLEAAKAAGFHPSVLPREARDVVESGRGAEVVAELVEATRNVLGVEEYLARCVLPHEALRAQVVAGEREGGQQQQEEQGEEEEGDGGEAEEEAEEEEVAQPETEEAPRQLAFMERIQLWQRARATDDAVIQWALAQAQVTASHHHGEAADQHRQVSSALVEHHLYTDSEPLQGFGVGRDRGSPSHDSVGGDTEASLQRMIGADTVHVPHMEDMTRSASRASPSRLAAAVAMPDPPPVLQVVARRPTPVAAAAAAAPTEAAAPQVLYMGDVDTQASYNIPVPTVAVAPQKAAKQVGAKKGATTRRRRRRRSGRSLVQRWVSPQVARQTRLQQAARERRQRARVVTPAGVRPAPSPSIVDDQQLLAGVQARRVGGDDSHSARPKTAAARYVKGARPGSKRGWRQQGWQHPARKLTGRPGTAQPTARRGRTRRDFVALVQQQQQPQQHQPQRVATTEQQLDAYSSLLAHRRLQPASTKVHAVTGATLTETGLNIAQQAHNKAVTHGPSVPSMGSLPMHATASMEVHPGGYIVRQGASSYRSQQRVLYDLAEYSRADSAVTEGVAAHRQQQQQQQAEVLQVPESVAEASTTRGRPLGRGVSEWKAGDDEAGVGKRGGSEAKKTTKKGRGARRRKKQKKKRGGLHSASPVSRTSLSPSRSRSRSGSPERRLLPRPLTPVPKSKPQDEDAESPWISKKFTLSGKQQARV